VQDALPGLAHQRDRSDLQAPASAERRAVKSGLATYRTSIIPCPGAASPILLLPICPPLTLPKKKPRRSGAEFNSSWHPAAHYLFAPLGLPCWGFRSAG
jgi:hypothetical protein